MTRSVLIVSPYFPPATVAGVHRARHLAKHLPAAGWTPLVVAVDEAYHEERLDPGLSSLVPPEVEIIKVPGLPAHLARKLGFGDISLRAWWPLRRTVLDLLERGQIDVVLITGSPYYPMLLASEIKRRFHVPVVLDFQDPWVSAWGATLPKWSKGGLAHRMAVMLEPRVVHAADYITSVSETQNFQMAERYSWLDKDRMAAIPIGGDPEDYDALRGMVGFGHPSQNGGRKTLSYIGTFMPRTGPVMEQLLMGFALARTQRPELLATVTLRFVGTSNQPNDTTTYSVRPLAEAYGISNAVEETPQRVPYLEAIGLLAKSDGILLVGSDEPHYTASKIYPALMSGRPYLSLFHERSSSHEILSLAGGGLALGFSDRPALEKLAPKIAAALIQLVGEPQALGVANPATYEHYTARSVSRQFAEIFDRIATRRSKAI